MWVTVEQGTERGVWLSEAEPPPPPTTAYMVAIANPPTASVRRVDPPPELAEAEVLGTVPLAVSIEYGDPEARLANYGFDGPVKPLIDSLWPVLGGGPGQPDDHRIRHLETLRGTVEGARVWDWPLPGAD